MRGRPELACRTPPAVFTAAEDTRLGCNVARFAREGVAAANFGPGLPAQAHQPNEYAKLPLLLESYEHLRVFLERAPQAP